MKNCLTIVLGLSLLVLTACANNSKQDKPSEPVWVLGESETYPRKRFLLGVGEGDTLSDAKSRARAELASNFHVKIDSQTVDNSAFESQLDAKGTSNITTNTAVARLIQSDTEQVLEGVAISDTWYDTVRQRYYALATLSRLKSANQLSQRIDELDQATASLIKQSKQSASIFEKSVLSKQAIISQQSRQALNQQYRVVSLTGQGIDSTWPIAKLEADRRALLARIRFSVIASGDYANEVKGLVSGFLASEGYRVVNDAADANYTIDAKMDSDELAPSGGWFISANTVSMTIHSQQEGVLSQHQWQYKASASQAASLKSRTLQALQANSEKELEHLLSQL